MLMHYTELINYTKCRMIVKRQETGIGRVSIFPPAVATPMGF
jgi:hypothetical protein